NDPQEERTKALPLSGGTVCRSHGAWVLSLGDGNHKHFGLFLVEVRCKLLNRLAMEPRTPTVLQVRSPLVTVTLVILCNLHPKFNLRCELSTSRRRKTARGKFRV